jgi:hypothetical protein
MADFRRNRRLMRGSVAMGDAKPGSEMKVVFLVAAAAFAAAAPPPAGPQTPVPSPALSAALSYADLADLALGAPVVAHVRVKDADRLSEREAPTVPAGTRRFLIEADVVALIRGDGGIVGPIRYVVDLRDESPGHPARIGRRAEYLVIARRVPDRPDELRLAAPDAQIPYSAEVAARLRAILRDSAGAAVPPRITGIGRAFSVPGSLPSESETQIFLQTADNRPISLNVLRRPGESPRWSVALSEIVDDAAAAPARETLLWYRLACTLPPRLPAASLSQANTDEARAIQADYRLIMEGLGPCIRTRTRR